MTAPKTKPPPDDAPRQPLAGDPPSEALVLRGAPGVEAQLVVVTGKNAAKTFALEADDNVIGRSSQAEVHLDDKSISTKHARVVRHGGLHAVIDLGSTNGTFLNGQRLAANQPVPLAFGDSIQVAETVLAYLPANGQGAEATQHLSRLLPQFPSATGLRMPDAGMLAQLLHTRALPQLDEPPAPTLEDHIATVMRILAIIRRNWIPVFAGVTLCALIGNLTVFLRPPPSEATFKLRMAPPQADDRSRNPQMETDQFYTVAEQDYLSTTLVESTLTALGEHPSPDNVASLRSELKFSTTEYMTYVGTFRSSDPSYAVRLLKRHLEGYLAYEVRRTLHVVQAEVDFLTERVKEREVELRKMETELKHFKNKHLEGLPENATSHIGSRETLLARRAELGAQASRANLELEAARRRLAQESPALGKRVESATPYEASIGEAKRKLTEARSKGLGEDHAEVSSLKKQIADLQRLADQARTTDSTDLERAANPKLLELKNRVAEAEVAAKGTGAELGAVGALLSRLDTIVATMPEVEAQYAQLTRAYSLNKETYSQLFEQLKASQLKLELERTSAKARYEIVSPPESVGTPIRKALIQRTGIGAGIGAVIGALIAAVMELKRYLRGRAAQRAQQSIVPRGYSA